MVTDTRIRVSKRLFCKILGIPNSGPYDELTSSQVVYMFNEMGHQPPLTRISDFKKSGLPTIWNFLFGIFLRCLTGRTVGLDKGRMEVYAMVAGLYYDLQVDYSEQLWTEFITSISKTSAKQGISCARYWSLIVQYVYQKEKIEVPDYEEKAVFHMYGSPKEVHDDPTIFTTVARIPDAMLKKVDPTNNVLVSYLQSIDTTVVTGILQKEEKKKS